MKEFKLFVSPIAKKSMSQHRLLQYTVYNRRAKHYKAKPTFKEVLANLIR